MTNILNALRQRAIYVLRFLASEDAAINYRPTPDRLQRDSTSTDFMTDLHIRSHLGR